MSFEIPRPEEQNEKITEAGIELNAIAVLDVRLLERAIRFMTPDKRQRLYEAIEMSKTATDDLFLK